MSKSSDTKPVVLSERVYRRLLAVYPAEYRKEYGEPMAQHFRDLCRDAWIASRGWGLAMLWIRTTGDLASTFIIEHLNNITLRKSMLDKALLTFRGILTPRATFLAVFLLAVCSALAVAFFTPEQYSSTARLRLENITIGGAPASSQEHLGGNVDPYFVQGQFELIQSDRMLSRVVNKLRLAEINTWRPGSGGTSETEAVTLLKQRLELRPVLNSSMIEIRAYSATPNQAAQIANALAETYREFNVEQTHPDLAGQPASTKSVYIVDTAVPGLRPVRPNRPFTLFVGILGGAILAGLGALVVIKCRRSLQASVAAA